MNYCRQCGKELINEQIWFCDINCENQFRKENQELYISYDGKKYNECVCPVKEFKETKDKLIVDNGYYKYTYSKSNIKKWKIDKCSCLQEFTEINVNEEFQ